MRVNAQDAALAALASQVQFLSAALQRMSGTNKTPFFLDDPVDDAFMLSSKRLEGMTRATYRLCSAIRATRTALHVNAGNHAQAIRHAFDVQGKPRMMFDAENEAERLFSEFIARMDVVLCDAEEEIREDFAGIVSTRDMVENILGSKGIYKACTDCRGRIADVVNVPCGHMLYCQNCALSKTTKCWQDGCNALVKMRVRAKP
jgi:hypothetical protein